MLKHWKKNILNNEIFLWEKNPCQQDLVQAVFVTICKSVILGTDFFSQSSFKSSNNIPPTGLHQVLYPESERKRKMPCFINAAEALDLSPPFIPWAMPSWLGYSLKLQLQKEGWRVLWALSSCGACLLGKEEIWVQIP